VIRLPEHWNGKLIVTGAPGIRRQYANDFIIGDWVLARGYERPGEGSTRSAAGSTAAAASCSGRGAAS
jgi:hypothetical protein